MVAPTQDHPAQAQKVVVRKAAQQAQQAQQAQAQQAQALAGCTQGHRAEVCNQLAVPY